MSIADNIAHIQETIAAACARANRNPGDVTLVAVSKTHPPSFVLEAITAGVQHFGENRVEESESKIAAVMQQTVQPVTWHMIGHVQSRKAKLVTPLFQVVHSVDSVKLAEKFSRLVAEAGTTLDVLLEINISGEASKEGFPAAGWSKDSAVKDSLWQTVRDVLVLPGLHVRGLMTVAPLAEQVETVRPVFAELAQLKVALESDFGVSMPDLSMGMTDDYPVAIEEGATLVRIGRAIFGERH